MTIKLYSTLSRKKEDFETIEPGKVRMYVCGVTVYNKAHIGHAMFSLVFDTLRRYLTYRGYEVRQVINFTDVDDKIINRASQLGMDPFQLAENYIAEFRGQIEALNVLPATVNPRATLEIHGKPIPVVAREAQGEEYNRLWKFATEHHPPYLKYQQMTTRHIPIMVFERVG